MENAAKNWALKKMDEVLTLNIKTEQSKYLNGAQPEKMTNKNFGKKNIIGWMGGIMNGHSMSGNSYSAAFMISYISLSDPISVEGFLHQWAEISLLAEFF